MRTPFRFAVTVGLSLFALLVPVSSLHAQVLFQQFYYPIDKPPKGTSWWRQATAELPALAKLGVSSIWHPVPVKGGSGAVSMGYDPYDLYDLGSKDQKGTIPTLFGTRDEYLAYVAAAHRLGLRVIADVVLNHTGGADRAEPNPLMERLGWDDIGDDSKVGRAFRSPDDRDENLRSWTRFQPVGASGAPGTGRFPRDYRHFHPSAIHPDRNGPYHNPEFAQDYCAEAEEGYVRKGLCEWGAWFRAQTGVDGFRLDAVKLIDPPFLAEFAEKMNGSVDERGFYLVGEFWDTNPGTLLDFQRATAHRMRLFDFGLFYALWDMTENPRAFDMRDLLIRRFADRQRAVLFVSNHDVDRFQPIRRDRRSLPYALILTLAGQPSVFYSDYFRAEDPRLPRTLETLIPVHNRFAVGEEVVHFADTDVLAVERSGNLLGLFHDGGDGKARTVTVPTNFGPKTTLRAVGRQEGEPDLTLTTGDDGRIVATVEPGKYLLLVRADADTKSNPDRFPRLPLRTTQVFEFADDLDTGRLGETPRTVFVTLSAPGAIQVRLTDTTGREPLEITFTGADGRPAGRVRGVRGKPTEYRTRLPRPGTYAITVRTSGPPTVGRLAVTY
ncbi:MAG: alpha-amylase family glycosyl hydrolase [Capsulimonadales bacterium]|nr:alpha-amylase family glycosyl hydrolase [Capsulimonadales bacterium]